MSYAPVLQISDEGTDLHIQIIKTVAVPKQAILDSINPTQQLIDAVAWNIAQEMLGSNAEHDAADFLATIS